MRIYIVMLRIIFCHIEAVRKTYEHMTDNDIGESVSKWLAQATLRVQRAKYVFI